MKSKIFEPDFASCKPNLAQNLPNTTVFPTLFRLLFTCVCCIAFSNTGFSQVPTVILNGNPISDHIPFHTGTTPAPQFLPTVNVNAALAEDAAAGIEIPRFGVKIPTFASKEDGSLEAYGDFLIWKKSFYSSKAKSLNLEFAELQLPKGAQMYIYNGMETMFSGPIGNEHVYEGQYASDVIKGDQVTVEVLMNSGDFDSFSILITNVIHGFTNVGGLQENEVEVRDYNHSGKCNVDVNCPAGAGWATQRDAVGLVIADGIWWCSGALINNACQDLRSYFLTAFHCLPNAAGSVNWAIRFNYDSPNPVAPTCRGDEPETWLTFTGANIRAASAASDVGLIELFGSVAGHSTLALAGWNRAAALPIAGTGIHHPRGDVKKISTIGALSITGDLGVVGTDHIQVTLATGTLEKGSSGSPLFDTGQRIIGQLHSGSPSCPTPTTPFWYGRFFTSWTGGGTAASRLSDWLGGNGNPLTTNTIRSPFVSGTSPVCFANNTFTLNNLVPGRTATWAVTPTSLFDVGANAATSGIGTSATLRAASSGATGPATLTFTLTLAGCNDIIVSLDIWVGKPLMPLTSPAGSPTPINIVVGQTLPVYVTYAQGAQSFVGNWTKGTALSMPTGPAAFKNFTAINTTGSNYFTVTTSNACGISPQKLGFFYISPFFNGGGGSLSLSPNPTNGSVLMSLSGISLGTKQLINSTDFSSGKITIYNMLGRPVHSEPLRSENQELDVSTLPRNVYMVEVMVGDERLMAKMMVVE